MGNRLSQLELDEINDNIGNGLGHYFSDGKYDWDILEDFKNDDGIIYDEPETVTYTLVIKRHE